MTSIYFWYSPVGDPRTTRSTVVILPDRNFGRAGLLRLIETAADLLVKKLASSYPLPTFYELVGDSLLEVAL